MLASQIELDCACENCRCHLFPQPEDITDGTVALACCVLLFVVPTQWHLPILTPSARSTRYDRLSEEGVATEVASDVQPQTCLEGDTGSGSLGHSQHRLVSKFDDEDGDNEFVELELQSVVGHEDSTGRSCNYSYASPLIAVQPSHPPTHFSLSYLSVLTPTIDTKN